MPTKKPANSSCPHCSSHDLTYKGYSRPLQCIAGNRRRYLHCRSCRRSFSENFHRHNYRLRHNDPALSAKILKLFLTGTSARQIASTLSISEHCVRVRSKRLAQQALVFQDKVLARMTPIQETLAYDGLENFAGSQYDPNNINQLIGSDSLFIYDFNFSPLNRKGRMSPWQRRHLAEIEKKHGRYNPRAIRVSTHDILRRNVARCCPSLGMRLRSDEHFQYRRVLQRDLGELALKVQHHTVSSRACRNFQNILFSVNHADLLIRQRIGAFSRETICFNKRAGVMCQRFALFMVTKNFMLPQFTKRHVRRPRAHLETPAQSLGLFPKPLEFGDIFSGRAKPSAVDSLNDDWKHFFRAQIPAKYTRQKRYVRTHAGSA